MRDEQLVDYLLGQLPADEADRLDELSIVDDEVAWRLRAAEQDLVDAYVRGELDAKTRARFESYYMASARRRERVKFARGFSGAVDGAATRGEADPARPIYRATHAVLSPRSTPVWWLAAAAAAIIALGMFIVQDQRLRRELAASAQTTAALDKRTSDLERQLAESRASSPAPASQSVAPATVPAVVRPSPAPAAASAPAVTGSPLVLSPDTRSASAIPAVTLAPGAGAMPIVLRLEVNDFAQYQATVKDPGTDAAVWRSEWSAARSKNGGSTVAIAVPANVLKAQHYAVELAGRRPSGPAEIVASYVFEVHPK